MAREVFVKITCDNGKCRNWDDIDVTGTTFSDEYDPTLDRYVDRAYWHCDDNGDDWCNDCWEEKLAEEDRSKEEVDEKEEK